MTPSFDDREIERRLRRMPREAPSPEARNRILARCGGEIDSSSERRRSSRQLLARYAVAAILLLVLNAAVERESNRRIAALIDGTPARAAAVSRPLDRDHLRHRARLLASLLNDDGA